MNTEFLGFWFGQVGKAALHRFGFVLVFALLVGLGGGPLNAGSLPKVWMDNASGYAIAGFDPVDYFVLKKAVRPEGQIEAFWGGVSWRFRNEGNKAAFLAHPRTYAPRFGGADPFLLSKRRAVLGNPTLFEVYNNGLYLFYSGVTLSSWKKHREAYITHAKQVWPKFAARLGLDPAKTVNPVNQPAADKTAHDDGDICEPARWLQAASKSK